MLVRFLLLCGLILILTSCKKNDVPVESVQASAPAIPLSAAPFLSQPLPTTVIESTNEALPIWRNFAKNRPTLVIVSNRPALIPVPAELRGETDKLLKSASDLELVRRSSPSTTDPLLLPIMSLNAALRAGWFSQVIWIFPSRPPPEQLNLATFQQQLIAARIASADEAASFTLKNGSFSGIIHNCPFTAAQAEALPVLEQSALLHIDIDYFKPLYKGEIKTPLYPLVIGLLDQIKNQGWKIAAATVVLSNQQDNGLPLQTRFVGKDLARVLQDPQMLKETFPRQWERRSNALYLENFMQKEEMRRVYLEMEKEDPRDPAIKFGLYSTARQFNKAEESLVYLRAAVQIDPAYAFEYLTLSQVALEKKRPEKTIEMLKLARAALPQNPFILMPLAYTLFTTGQRNEANIVFNQLAALDWSKIYYPEQVKAVTELKTLLQNRP